jgi:putative heme degradation protein
MFNQGETMTDTTKPEALRLADELEVSDGMFVKHRAADELRRLHAENEALREALESLLYWDNGKPEFEEARVALKGEK